MGKSKWSIPSLIKKNFFYLIYSILFYILASSYELSLLLPHSQPSFRYEFHFLSLSVASKIYEDTFELGLRLRVRSFDDWDDGGDYLFVLLFFQEQKDNVYLLRRVQGCRRYWILLYFWRTNPLFLIKNGGFFFKGWKPYYSRGLLAIREGDHTRLPISSFPILLHLFHQGVSWDFRQKKIPQQTGQS